MVPNLQRLLLGWRLRIGNIGDLFKTSVAGFIMLGGSLAWCVFLYFHLPAPGKAIGVLAVIATLMALRGEMGHREKSLWMLALFAFLFIEFRAINKDRTDHDNEVRAERKQFEANFKSIAEGLNTSISNSQKQFDAMMRRTNSVLTSVTGGTAYTVVMPDTFIRGDNEFPLLIENHGDQILTGVTVTVYKYGAFTLGTSGEILQSVNNRINVGTLHVGERLVLATRIRPLGAMEFEEKDVHMYRAFILVAAQNFTTEELLDFKKDVDGTWLFKYMTGENPPVVHQLQLGPPRKTPPAVMFEEIKWTKDPNEIVRLR